MSGKALVIVKENLIVTYSTRDVDVAVVIDGENVQLPDDWRDLPMVIKHSLPISVRAAEMFDLGSSSSGDEFIPDFENDQNDELCTRCGYSLADHPYRGSGDSDLNQLICYVRKGDRMLTIREDEHFDDIEAPGRARDYPEPGAATGTFQVGDCAGCYVDHSSEECPRRTCPGCGSVYGTKHGTECADQNPLVEGGDIVGGQTALLGGLKRCLVCNTTHAPGSCPIDSDSPHIQSRGATRMAK